MSSPKSVFQISSSNKWFPFDYFGHALFYLILNLKSLFLIQLIGKGIHFFFPNVYDTKSRLFIMKLYY